MYLLNLLGTIHKSRDRGRGEGGSAKRSLWITRGEGTGVFVVDEEIIHHTKAKFGPYFRQFCLQNGFFAIFGIFQVKFIMHKSCDLPRSWGWGLAKDHF